MAPARCGFLVISACKEDVAKHDGVVLAHSSAGDTAEGCGESPAASEEATRQSPLAKTPTTRPAAGKMAAAPVLPPAADKETLAAVLPPAADKVVAAGTAAAAAAGAAAAVKPSAVEEDDEDLEISDEDGAAAEAGDSDVDEDWGGDWE